MIHDIALPGLRGKRAGFTLIELMIVVAIIGILAMIGIPSYEKYILRSNRAVAKQHMLALASKQEQYILDARVYAATPAALGMAAPSEMTNKYTFDFAVCAAPCTTYTIIATAIGRQAPDGWLKLDNLGQKTSEFPDKW